MGLVIPAVVIASLVAVVAFLYHRLCFRAASLPVTAEWIDELSVDRYQPMMRLLENEDIRYLRSRPGFTPAMATQFRRERCRIFRSYLHCLVVDFQRVSMALKVVMVQSRYDRPDLAAVLVRSQRAFALGVVEVHCRLFLYRAGLASVDPAGLLKLFDGARLELRSLVPAPIGLAA